MWAESVDASGVQVKDCASISHSPHRMNSYSSRKLDLQKGHNGKSGKFKLDNE